jgi:hypothetical protein
LLYSPAATRKLPSEIAAKLKLKSGKQKAEIEWIMGKTNIEHSTSNAQL